MKKLVIIITEEKLVDGGVISTRETVGDIELERREIEWALDELRIKNK